MAVSVDINVKVKPKTKKKVAESNVVKKRKGGTLIQSPVVFSHDTEYLFVNSGWGVRAFSIKTGECVKVLETSLSGLGRVLSVFLVDNFPVIATLNDDNKMFLLYWDMKGSAIKKKFEVKLPEKFKNYSGVNALLAPSFNNKLAQDLCIVLRISLEECFVLFYDLNTVTILAHPLNGTEVTYSPGKHYLSFGGAPDLKLMATLVNRNKVSVYSIDGTMKITGLTAAEGIDWTSICCHPMDVSIAVGDSLGRCVLFKNPLLHPKVRAVFHWHTLPCDVIAFTPAGSTMYTGAGEHVLVKWTIENPNVKNFLPRLSAPIVHISMAPDNSLVAVSTLDNGVILVESSHRVSKVLQQMAWGVLSHKNAKLFPAGLTFDPVSRSIVLNSRPGHLQFFCPETEHQTSVDICQQNYLTQERDKIIVNTDVTFVALSSDSAWMATVESRQEDNVSLELRLKFWEYEVTSKRWILNSVVDMPHSGVVNSLKFQPLSSQQNNSQDYLVVTTGDDSKFRLWSPSPIDSVYKKGVMWKCDGAASYKDQQVGPACFSQDGSLLAVAFQHILTLWSSNEIRFKTSLSRFPPTIKQVEFGREICSHLLVATSENELVVWNLLTLCVQWTAKVEPSFLVADPFSTFMAVISNNTKTMYVFSPLHSEIVHEEKNLCGHCDKVLGACFALRECENWKAPQWLCKSIFYYIDSNQELKSIETAEDSDSGVNIIMDKEKRTLFGDLKRAQSVSNVKITHDNHPRRHQYGILGSTAVKEFLQAPCHTMAPVSTLCTSLLEAFSLSKKPVKEREQEDRMQVDEEDSDEGLGNESDSSIGSSDSPKVASKTKSSDFSSPSFSTPPTSLKPKSGDLFFIDFED